MDGTEVNHTKHHPTSRITPPLNHQLTLGEEGTLLLRESRMIIPGIQAIFGFQLIAVFSEGFGERLEKHHEIIHLMAMILVLISIALVMGPAIYQRRVEPQKISRDFIRRSGEMLVWGLRAFTLGLAADVGVITYAVTESDAGALLLSLSALGFLSWLWFFFGTPLNLKGNIKTRTFFSTHFVTLKSGAKSVHASAAKSADAVTKAALSATKNTAAAVKSTAISINQKYLQRYKTALMNAGFRYLN